MILRWVCYRYYGYSQPKNFTGSIIASFSQLLHFRLMWSHDILDLRRISALQVRKLWRNSPFAGPNMKTWMFECMYVYSYPRWPYGNIFNNVHNSFLIFTVVARFVCSTAISIDRCSGVTKPFQYRAFATKKNLL